MSITQELSTLLTRPPKDIARPPPKKSGADLVNGFIAGVFFAVAILVGTGNAWLALNFGFGMFLVIGNVLRFDDRTLGLTSGFLAALCASGVIGSWFGPEAGRITALGLFASVAPAVHLMDTQPGWGRGGRTFFAVCWAVAMTTIFLVWFLDSHALHFVS